MGESRGAFKEFATSGRSVLEGLKAPNESFARRVPGDREGRQPVHVVYGGAQLFTAETCRKLGRKALACLEEYGGDPIGFAQVLGMPGAETLPPPGLMRAAFGQRFADDRDKLREENPAAWLAFAVHERVRGKLEAEPVEDFRIDFEDGFGVRPGAEEDEHALRAAEETARAHREGKLPPFIGIRIKPFTEELKERSARTLGLYVTTLVEAMGGSLPPGFVVTLPKISVPEQVTALVRLCESLESLTGLSSGALRIELMVELTRSLIDHEGRNLLPLLLEACEGRCFGAHFGTYDYTASVGVTAAEQRMDHPHCDAARTAMQVALAGTGVFLSDGATNIMPVPPHKGDDLGSVLRAENRRVVQDAWRLAFEHTRHSLSQGIYQGWDLHPNQLPARYAACYSFFLEGFAAASERLRNFIGKAAQATLVGDVFDDAATGQGLLNYFLRARNCGAITEAELLSTGLTADEIRTRSFLAILEGRKG